MIYKRGCDKAGPDGSCSKCGKRRACGVYWYKFMWQGKLIRESTKQGNDKVARQIESAHRTSLAKGEVGIREKKPAPTLGDFIDKRFEPWVKATFEKSSPKTWRDWYRVGLRAIKAYGPLAGTKLDEITSEKIAGFAANRQGKNLQVSTINSSLRVLRRFADGGGVGRIGNDAKDQIVVRREAPGACGHARRGSTLSLGCSRIGRLNGRCSC